MRAWSLRLEEDRPKSSLTEALSADLEDEEEAPPSPADSEVDLPRNSQRDVRAKPCWGSCDVALWSGAVPKT